MSDFNEGLRIEVENDLFRKDGEEVAADNLAEMGPASPYESEKEDGELSGNNSPSRDMDETAMEVDGVDGADDEEGMRRGRSHSHSSEGKMPRSSSLEKVYRPRTYPNPYLNDVLVSEEKLNSRAARFGIAAGPQGNNGPARVEQPLPTDTEILNLYSLVGLIEDDGGEPTLEKVGSNYRLNSILIRGTNQMSTNDIFAYLRDNNQRPCEMEWVNDACCVVIFKDRYEAARAMLSMTKPVAVEPRPERKETEDGGLEPDTEEMNEDFDFQNAETISSRYITVPMPPGYTWRFAAPCKQARGILMRYATAQDKKQEKSERHSEYYKKFGNPNYSVGFGLVTSSFRNRLQKKKSVEAPGPPEPEEEKEKQPVSNRLAWAQLSQRWNDEEIAAAEGRPLKPPKPAAAKSSGGGGNLPRPRNESPQVFGPIKKNIKVLVDFEDRASVKTRLKRRRHLQEGEEREDNVEYDSESDDEEEKWSKKLKGPRMRMHADEEEQKMKDRMRRQGVSGGGGGGSYRGRPQGGNVHSRINNRLSWPGSYRPRVNLDDDY